VTETPDLAAQIACIQREIAMPRKSARDRRLATTERLRAVLATLETLADRDSLAKALLRVARTKELMRLKRFNSSGRDGDFWALDEWPELDPAESADSIFAVFFAQDEGGRNICENWRREGDALRTALLALAAR
jgi:hypothetical protein